jgi:PhnB protein
MLLEKSQIPAGHNVVNMFVLIKGGADRFITFVEDVIGGKERAEVRTPDKDGTLIHAEIQLGDSTLMLADSKPSWPYTPAFIQVYVQDAQIVLDKAQQAGGEVVTEVSRFYNGYRLARMKDPWGNMWWLYEPDREKQRAEPESDVSWHDQSPSQIYTTLMSAMEHLSADK